MPSLTLQPRTWNFEEGGVGAFYITDPGNECIHYKEQELSSQPTNHIASSAVISQFPIPFSWCIPVVRDPKHFFFSLLLGCFRSI